MGGYPFFRKTGITPFTNTPADQPADPKLELTTEFGPAVASAGQLGRPGEFSDSKQVITPELK
jgi:hypothetical protein